MATITDRGTLTVNAAFLEEVKEVHEELWEVLSSLRLQHQQRDRQRCRELVEATCKLRDLLALHFSLEEALGYFSEPVSVAPHLSERAHQLRDEHKELYLLCSQMAEQGEELLMRGRRAALLQQLGDAFQTFDERLQVHEEGERELIANAYNEDIGVGD